MALASRDSLASSRESVDSSRPWGAAASLALSTAGAAAREPPPYVPEIKLEVRGPARMKPCLFNPLLADTYRRGSGANSNLADPGRCLGRTASGSSCCSPTASPPRCAEHGLSPAARAIAPSDCRARRAHRPSSWPRSSQSPSMRSPRGLPTLGGRGVHPNPFPPAGIRSRIRRMGHSAGRAPACWRAKAMTETARPPAGHLHGRADAGARRLLLLRVSRHPVSTSSLALVRITATHAMGVVSVMSYLTHLRVSRRGPPRFSTA